MEYSLGTYKEFDSLLNKYKDDDKPRYHNVFNNFVTQRDLELIHLIAPFGYIKIGEDLFWVTESGKDFINSGGFTRLYNKNIIDSRNRSKRQATALSSENSNIIRNWVLIVSSIVTLGILIYKC